MIPDRLPTTIMSSHHEEAHPGYETTDVKVGGVWIAAAGVVVGVGLVIAGIALMFHFLHRRDLAAQQRGEINRVTKDVAETRARFPVPRLQVAPQLDLAALRAREDAELNSYGWIDRKSGVVRIPIERAMDLVTRRGLPVRGQPNAPKPTRTSLEMQQARPLQREKSEAPQ